MSNCGCSGICACEFSLGETTAIEGNGQIATPFAVHLNDIPYRRPVGMYSRVAVIPSLTGGVTTQILFDTNELIGPEGDFSAGTMDSSFAGSAFTVPAGGAGIYLVGGFVEWAALVTVATTRSFWIARNGSTDVLTRGVCAVTNTFDPNIRNILQSISGLVSLEVGDILRAYVATGEAASIDITEAAGSKCYPYMYAQYMGAAS